MPRLPVTCTIIAQNERDRIGRTIDSVRDLATEVLVIDSGSTDGTQDYCRSLGARVIENPWPGFGPQKRFAEENASHDWILNLDADEWLSDELRAEFAALLEAGEPAAKTWRMRMTLVHPHRERPHVFADYHDYVRFYDRRAARFPTSLTHDEVKPLAGSPQFRAPAYHQSFRSFDHLVRKELDYYRQQKKELKKSRLALALRLPFEFPLQFVKYYFGRGHVFGGVYGWQLASVLAFMRWLRLVILMGGDCHPRRRPQVAGKGIQSGAARCVAAERRIPFPSLRSAGNDRALRTSAIAFAVPACEFRLGETSGKAPMASKMSEDLRSGALVYHRLPKPGKLEVVPTKPLANQRDLALAYSPGVAAACEAIAEEAGQAAELTARQNLVAVVSNGTAVLGLGDIGPLASKPVMEGKAVLFKKFAGIDVFDIEVAEKDVDRLVDVVAALEPTFGGVNLEDIKAPECFEVERKLKERMAIPVFHDDQHGTAIIVGAAVTNALELAGKDIGSVKVVASGAGAAALACLNLLVSLGVRRENVWVTDLEGVVYEGREKLMDRWKSVYAQKTDARTLAEVIAGADVFLGLSAGGVLKKEMLAKMANKPLILALANPNPEIMPEEALEVRPDAMLCTGRSDYPNQVNNVLCFPYIFRGALDVGAREINEEMKHAAVRAIAQLSREAPSDVAARAYGGEVKTFGPESLIPSPFDPRLILRVAPAVARAAMETGVARAPIEDFVAYEARLSGFVFRSGFIMKPVFTRAKADPRRVIYADGEDERVMRAAQVVIEEGIARPILIGRPQVVETRLQRFGLSIRQGRDFELVNPQQDERYRDYVAAYVEAAGRKGITPDAARTLVRTNTTIIAAIAVRRGDADAMLCGLEGRFATRIRHLKDILGLAPGVRDLSSMTLMITGKGSFFLADTHVRQNPGAEEIADTTIMCARHVRRFGLPPKIALISHSDFGASESPSATKMREALAIISARAPELEVDGEMQADTALSQVLRDRKLPGSRLKGEANVLVMPNLDAANIAYQMTRMLADALPVGPILLGVARPAHVLSTSVTARGVVNMTAIAVAEAQALTEARPIRMA